MLDKTYLFDKMYKNILYNLNNLFLFFKKMMNNDNEDESQKI